MKVFIPYVSNQEIGGGYTFYRNFVKGIENRKEIELVPENENPDILFSFSPSTISGEIIDRAKKNGAIFVLRMDGVPEDSRNSGKGTRNLVDYSKKADHIIYQSQFIKNTVGTMLCNQGVNCSDTIILNGVDTDVFTPFKPKIQFQGNIKILHVAYRKDNNKRYEEVVAMYREYFPSNPNANLLLLGRYPTEWQDYNMGFFNGEHFQRLGVIDDVNLKAQMMRSADFLFYPSFADPAPNVVLEALASGLPILYCPYGGVAEMVKDGGIAIDYSKPFTDLVNMMITNRNYLSTKARIRAEELSIHEMIDKYIVIFQSLFIQKQTKNL